MSPGPGGVRPGPGAANRGLRVVLWVLSMAALVLHCWLLYSTSPPSPVGFTGSDKLAHFCIFGGTAGLFALAGVPARVLWPVGLVHAVESELVQHYWVPGRTGSPFDLLADLAGIAFALWLAARLLGGPLGRWLRGPGQAAARPGAARHGTH